MTDPTETIAPSPADDAAPRRPRRRRLSRRTTVLIVVAGALLLAAAAVAGVLIATHLDTEAAIAERDDARQAAVAARASLTAATAAAAASSTELSTLVTATDAGLAVTGAGIDAAARTTLGEAQAVASAVLDEEGEPAASPEAPDPDAEADTASEYRALADAYDEQARALERGAAAERERGAALDAAAADLEAAVDAYAAATATAGARLLAARDDAADKVIAALQTQLDALPATEPTELATALAAYRKAVNAVVASSDAARAPKTPGGTGVRITDPASLTVVVNKRRGLPADYVPPGLRTPSGIPGATQVRSELIAPLERMRADMAAAGITLRMSSAYRSYARQQTIYNGFVANEGVAGADTHSARPGNSEHQTGLAVDLDDGAGCNLNACFANTAGGKWLAANAWKYGFILRYGKGWQPIVGYTYEPWHYRFVGENVAADMHTTGTRTLEEYFGLPAAPDYG